MSNKGEKNVAFLNNVTEESKSIILKNIADHYGISSEDAYDEIADEEAEYIFEYVVGDLKKKVFKIFNDLHKIY